MTRFISSIIAFPILLMLFMTLAISVRFAIVPIIFTLWFFIWAVRQDAGSNE